MEQISSTLLDEIELFLNDRVQLTLDGKPNKAMKLLMEIQAERSKATHDPDQPLDHNGDPF